MFIMQYTATTLNLSRWVHIILPVIGATLFIKLFILADKQLYESINSGQDI